MAKPLAISAVIARTFVPGMMIARISFGIVTTQVAIPGSIAIIRKGMVTCTSYTPWVLISADSLTGWLQAGCVLAKGAELTFEA